jgi:ferredoxin
MIAASVTAASRPILWNIPLGLVVYMYAGMVVALAIATWGVWRRVRIWRLGKPEVRTDHWPQRLQRVTVDALLQRVVVRARAPGLAHAALWSGFVVLFGATLVVMAQMDLGLPVLRGRLYLWFVSLAGNVFGLLALLGVAFALVRRYLVRPPGLERREPADALVLVALLLLLASGFVLSGLRIAATHDAWQGWRPVASATASLLAAWLPADALAPLHRYTWLGHVTLWYVILAALPYTKLLHMGTVPLAIYFGNLRPGPELPAIDFEDETALETLGVKTALELTWKQLLDLDACTECGRCERVCPPHATGSSLSPKRVILGIRDRVRADAAALRAARAAQTRGQPDAAALREALPALPDVVGQDALWACTTCRACEATCPAGIEHVRLILQLRQNLAMEQALLPEGLAQLPRQLELRDHPFCGVPVDRHAWFVEAVAAEAGAVVAHGEEVSR